MKAFEIPLDDLFKSKLSFPHVSLPAPMIQPEVHGHTVNWPIGLIVTLVMVVGIGVTVYYLHKPKKGDGFS